MIEEHIAGDTLDFYDSIPDYPATNGWTLKYRLVPRFTSPAQDPIDIEAAPQSDDTYRVQVASDVTATWKAGYYTWSRWVEKSGPIRQSVGDGQLRIKENPATAVAGYDGRSHARKMLDQVEAALEALRLGVESYTIGTRAWKRSDLEELIILRDRCRLDVATEEGNAAAASGLPNPRYFKTRFTDA